MDKGMQIACALEEKRAAFESTDDVLAPDDKPLNDGERIIAGRYRITQLLYQRPRLNLYLGRRVSSRHVSTEMPVRHNEHEPLVAIRELLLSGLPSLLRAQIEVAAFEEFVSPIVLGSPRLPTEGDRVWVEGERHYLIMQLQNHRDDAEVGTLEDLLLRHAQWPNWLSHEIALHWGTQLCRIVARLHRLGVVLANLDSATILVDHRGDAAWAPILLTSWPPAPQCWPTDSMEQPVSEVYAGVFPVAIGAEQHAFAAPEVLEGVCDERSDVYSLGAILYLLLTGYAPMAAARRLWMASKRQESSCEQGKLPTEEKGTVSTSYDDAFALISPRLLCSRLPAVLEEVLLTALDLDPARRYASAFELVEALEMAEMAMVSRC